MSAWLATRNSVLSTFNAVNINYSTLSGSTLNTSTINVSTIFDSTITTRQMNFSTLQGSTITTESVSYSTLTGSSIVSNVVTGSVIGGNVMTTSTLTTTGNVGIGTASPGKLLTIYGINNMFSLANSNINNSTYMSFVANGTDYGYIGLDSSTGGGLFGSGVAYGFDIGAPSNTPISFCTNNAIRMTILGNGNVGIGITNPTFPLHVVNSAVKYNVGATYYMNGASTLQLWNDGNFASVGIYAALSIWTGSIFVANSDIRTKKNIKYLNDCLYKLDQINIVSYDKIDFKEGGVDAGIIAQELQPILPKAVQTTKQVIPNIYACATHKKENGYIQITVSLPQNIKENTLCRLNIIKGDKEETYESSIYNITETLFNIAEWKDYSEDDKVFAYGTEVDDFLTVDKDQIGILAAGGVKELHQIIKEQQTHIVQLEPKVALLEPKVASLESQLQQLLAWAKTQGFQ